MKKDVEKKLTQELRSKLLLLPDFAADFILSLENTKEIRTRIEYSRDIITFIEFLKLDKGKDDITVEDLEKLKRKDFQNFLDYLTEYQKTFTSPTGKTLTQTYQNGDSGKSRKMASVHELFQFLFIEGDISSNITSKIKVYIKKKAKIKDRLTGKELELLFKTIMDEDNVPTKKASAYAKKQKYRDYAIVSLLAYSGIRVGELVQLDVEDVSVEYEAIVVTRKGGDEERIPLPSEVIVDVMEYLNYRKTIETSDPALFISQQKLRMNTRTVANMLSKYGTRAGFEFKITPHVFRRTFGTAHYNRYGDISLTGKLLGHKSTETTRRFYAEISDKRIEKSMKDFTYDD